MKKLIPPPPTKQPLRCPFLPTESTPLAECPLVVPPSAKVRLTTIETVVLVLGVEFWERAVVYESRLHGADFLKTDMWLCLGSGMTFFFCLFLMWLEIRRHHK
jgi:hypothetical protein